MLLFPAVPFAMALAASLVAAFTDVRKYRIYDSLTWPLLISGLVYHSVVVEGAGWVPSVLGFSVGFVPMALFYLSGGVGAGDVKLMGALGAWLGPVIILQVLFTSWIAAGLYAVGILTWNAVARDSEHVPYRLPPLGLGSDQQISQLVALPDRRRRLIPFGVMILTGVVGSLISTENIL